MKNKYKVTLYTKCFDESTDIGHENMISYVDIVAENTSEVKERINWRFKGRKEIIKIEKYNDET